MTASGFPKPTFSRSSLTPLPTGVTFTAAGLLSGTPTVAGTFHLTFTASNGVAPIATQSFTLTVSPALAFSFSIASATYKHNFGTISLNGASNKNSVSPSPTYFLVITSQSPTFTGTANIANTGPNPGQITISGFSQYVGKVTFTETVKWNGLTKSRSFTFTFVNHAPTLAAIANPPAMTHGPGHSTSVALTFGDVDGDALTFTPTATPYSALYNLEQKLHLTYVPKYDNLYKIGEKWLQSAAGNWYALRLVNGNSNLYASGFVGVASVPLGALVASFAGSSVYNDPTLIQNATPPPTSLPGTVIFSPINKTSSTTGTLTITPPSNFIGQFQVTVIVSDGLASVSRTFVVTVN
jgi:hypothetical protein